MKFKELTEEQIEVARTTYTNKELPWDERMQTLMQYFDKSERTVRKWAVKLGFKERADIEPEIVVQAMKKEHDKSKKRFLITWGQNATRVHTKFWQNLKTYAEFIDAEILVIPGRYHNLTNTYYDSKDKYDNQEWWTSEITPYLTLNRHNLNKNICIFSDVPIQPTASMPLNGMESLTIGQSGIVGHPRVHLKTLPVLDSKNPRVLLTTGACTIKNFSHSKAGKIGEFHHTLGAAIVELNGEDKFYVRQITAEDKTGNFIDLFYEVNDAKVSRIKESAALVKGDIHYGNHDETILSKSFNELVPLINPNQIILHDVFDGYSINHHEAQNFVIQYQNEVNGTNSLKKEIDNLLNWIDSIKQYNLVIVFSNHDDFLTRFIINGDPKKNVKNALEYMEYGKVLLEGSAPNGLIPYLINEKFKDIKCLGRDESYMLKGWELGIHGMDGVNGSRGSISQYKRLNSKAISAHAHSPVRMDGALQVGTNTLLRMRYNHGISTWAHSDVIIHKNNKAQHILYDSDGNFTTFEY